jgi:peptide-methionine (S)-S-oxide reductase
MMWTLSSLVRASVVAILAAVAASAGQQAPAGQPARSETAVFAGGCFWCTEADFDKVKGVLSTTSGYTGGHKDKPTYEQVSAGGTGHVEAVQVVYDPTLVSYDALVELFWRTIDPFNARGQFCDTGESYRPVIFVADERQRTAATSSRDRMQKQFKDRIVVEITPAATFYRAEDYHQDYYKKNPVRYNFYRWNCGRDSRLARVWGEH